MLTVAQNIPTMLVYLPPQLTVSSQVCVILKGHKGYDILLYIYFIISPAEPVSVWCGRSGGGVVREEKEAVGSG